jgi:hypothetical protein
MTQAEPKIKDLMPRGYGPILKARTGKSLVHIYTVVNDEQTDTPIWSEVMKLAEETIQRKQQNRSRLDKLKSQAA